MHRSGSRRGHRGGHRHCRIELLWIKAPLTRRDRAGSALRSGPPARRARRPTAPAMRTQPSIRAVPVVYTGIAAFPSWCRSSRRTGEEMAGVRVVDPKGSPRRSRDADRQKTIMTRLWTISAPTGMPSRGSVLRPPVARQGRLTPSPPRSSTLDP